MAQPRHPRCNLSQQLAESTQPGEYLLCGVASCLTLLSETCPVSGQCPLYFCPGRPGTSLEDADQDARPHIGTLQSPIADPIPHVCAKAFQHHQKHHDRFCQAWFCIKYWPFDNMNKGENTVLQCSLQVVSVPVSGPSGLFPFSVFSHAPVLSRSQQMNPNITPD